ECHRAFFQLDIAFVGVAYEPVLTAKVPNLDAARVECVHRPMSDLSLQKMLGDDRKIGSRQHTAVETADRRRDAEGLEQHAQTAWRPTADNRKNDSICAQLFDYRPGAHGQYLVISHQ